MNSNLSELLYTPLTDGVEQFTGWSKSTIDYVVSHKSKVCASIRGIAKNSNKLLQHADTEDIFMELLRYLYTCDDYNVDKAYRKSKSGNIVSFDGYIHSCIKYCVIRYITEAYKDESHVIHDTVKDTEGDEVSIFDRLTDTRTENCLDSIEYDLNSLCKLYEDKRYKYGVDLFQLWYIRVQTLIYNKNAHYADILEVLGVSHRDIANAEKEASRDCIMLSMAKAVTRLSGEEAAKILEKYTYSALKIKKVVELF